MNKIEEQLFRDEGEKLHAYQDHLGYWTIGVGHLIDKRKGGGISQKVSRLLLKEDIAVKIEELYARLPWIVSLDTARFGALVNMAFQLGVGGLVGFPNMLAALKARNYKAAAAHALDSKWAREDTPARAQRIAKQILTGEWQ